MMSWTDLPEPKSHRQRSEAEPTRCASKATYRDEELSVRACVRASSPQRGTDQQATATSFPRERSSRPTIGVRVEET